MSDRIGTALFAAAHVAAYTLLGMTVYNAVAEPQTVAAAPDIPLDQPDPPPSRDAA